MSELLGITPVRLAQQVCADCGDNWDEANFGVRLIMEKSAKAHLDALSKLITPASSPTAEDVHIESVRTKFLQRSKLGIAKYGTTLSASGIDHEGYLRHLQEELMDAAAYIEGALVAIARQRGEKT